MLIFEPSQKQRYKILLHILITNSPKLSENSGENLEVMIWLSKTSAG